MKPMLRIEDCASGSVVECMGHHWKIVGVHLGAVGQESLIEIENVNYEPGWTGEWEYHPRMFVPEVLLCSVAIALTPETPSMWAEVTRDDFSDQVVWSCQERDGRGEIADHEVVELRASTFPIGTRLAITEPALTPEA